MGRTELEATVAVLYCLVLKLPLPGPPYVSPSLPLCLFYLIVVSGSVRNTWMTSHRCTLIKSPWDPSEVPKASCSLPWLWHLLCSEEVVCLFRVPHLLFIDLNMSSQQPLLVSPDTYPDLYPLGLVSASLGLLRTC